MSEFVLDGYPFLGEVAKEVVDEAISASEAGLQPPSNHPGASACLDCRGMCYGSCSRSTPGHRPTLQGVQKHPDHPWFARSDTPARPDAGPEPNGERPERPEPAWYRAAAQFGFQARIGALNRYPDVYLSNKMTGVEDYNFPWFRDVTRQLRSEGWNVKAPHEKDEQEGFDPTGQGEPLPHEQLMPMLRRDIGDLISCDCVIVGPDWKDSSGSRFEVHVARGLGLPVFAWPDLEVVYAGTKKDRPLSCPDVVVARVESPEVPSELTKILAEAVERMRALRENPIRSLELNGLRNLVNSGVSALPEDDGETILQEADRLVATDRQSDYGHPLDDFTRTGRMWAAILGIEEVTPEEVGLCMVALKVSRECNAHKRDNLVDASGYAKTIDLVHAERARRG